MSVGLGGVERLVSWTVGVVDRGSHRGAGVLDGASHSYLLNYVEYMYIVSTEA